MALYNGGPNQFDGLLGKPKTGAPSMPAVGGMETNVGGGLAGGGGTQEGGTNQGVPDYLRAGTAPTVNMQADTGTSQAGSGASGGVPDYLRAGTASNGVPDYLRTGTPGTTTFGAGSNLINSQFNPTPSTRTQNAQGAADTAMGAYTGYQPKPFQSMSPIDTSPTSNLYGQANQQVQGLTASPYQAVAGSDQSRTRSLLDQAAGGVNPSSTLTSLAAQGGGAGGFGYGADTTGVRSQTTGQLNTVLQNTPDRAKLAADAYALLQERAQPAYEQSLRSVGQKAAALGRVGSGLTTNELGDVATLHDRTLDQSRRQLAGDAASLTLQDQLSKLGAAQGVLGQLGGLDTSAGQLNLGYAQQNNQSRNDAFRNQFDLENARYGRLTDLAGRENQLATQGRNEQLGERDARIEAETRGNALGITKANANRTYGSDLYGLQSDAYGRAADERNAANAYDQQTFNNRRNVFGDTAGYAQQLENSDRANRDELRGERGYQYGLSRDAQGDAIDQYRAQEGQYGNDFNRALDQYTVGYGADPSALYGEQQQQAQGQADSSLGGIGDLIGAFAKSRSAGRAIPQPPVAAYTDYAGMIPALN